MQIITFASWKGGTGKTTLAVSAITTLAKQGKKILVIDLDSNLSMTRVFGATNLGITSIDLLNDPKTSAGFQTNVKNVTITPSDLRISRMTNLSDRVLLNSLKKIDLSYYDYVFIDPPGTMNALTRNAMCAADKIIIPAMPSMIDFEATGLVIEEMEMMGIEADVQIVLNGWDPKRNTDWILGKFHSEYDELMINNEVPAMKSLKNLTANVSSYNITGKAKQIVDRFVREVIL